MPQSRALGVQARTLEVLDVMGLADAFVERGHRVRRFRVYSSDKGPCSSLTSPETARHTGSHSCFPSARPKCCCAPAYASWVASSNKV